MELRTLRYNMGVPIEKISLDTGISVAALYQYEAKTTIPLFATACKLADYYGVTLDDLRSFFAC